MEKPRIKNDEKEKNETKPAFLCEFWLACFSIWLVFPLVFRMCFACSVLFDLVFFFDVFVLLCFHISKKMLLFFKDSSCLVNITFVASSQLTAWPHTMASAKRCREKASSVSWALVEVLCQGHGIGPPGPSLAGSRARSPSPGARPVPFEWKTGW